MKRIHSGHEPFDRIDPFDTYFLGKQVECCVCHGTSEFEEEDRDLVMMKSFSGGSSTSYASAYVRKDENEWRLVWRCPECFVANETWSKNAVDARVPKDWTRQVVKTI